MITQDESKLGTYFRMRNESIFEHIDETGMLVNGIYATGAELWQHLPC